MTALRFIGRSTPQVEYPLSRLKIGRLLPLILALIISGGAVAKTTIVHPKSNDPKENLILKILQLAISKSGKSGKYTYEEFSEVITEARMVSMVDDGSMSVMWAGTQRKYEEDMLPIRIPVLKGMLGHRIFIIRKGDQTKFDRVSTLSQLQEIPLGQGRSWGDTVVLKHSNLKVIAPVKYESLFYMLEGGRFDFFPRALHEPWSEVSSRPELNLTIEEKILLIYPFAMYFFVGPEERVLANDIERGFRRAIEDGSFDQLFFSHPMIKDALELSNLSDRIIFRLPNPNMSRQTPVDDKSLWLNIEDL